MAGVDCLCVTSPGGAPHSGKSVGRAWGGKVSTARTGRAQGGWGGVRLRRGRNVVRSLFTRPALAGCRVAGGGHGHCVSLRGGELTRDTRLGRSKVAPLYGPVWAKNALRVGTKGTRTGDTKAVHSHTPTPHDPADAQSSQQVRRAPTWRFRLGG